VKTFSSLAAVVALWLGVSFGFWLVYRLFRRRDGSRQRQIAGGALSLLDEGAAVFGALRARASASPGAEGSYRWPGEDGGDPLQGDVRHLLNAIEAQSAFFDRVKAAKKKIEKAFGVEDFLPLGEILQIRRDFWAASEIFLIDDIRTLGAELAQVRAYETFKAEALALLFKEEDAAVPAEGDPVTMRLVFARQEASAFAARVAEAVAAEREKSRLPTPAEIIAVPVTAVRAAAFVLREGRTVLSEAGATAKSFARFVGSKGLKAAAIELRRERAGLPGHFASAFERAGGLAREGGGGLKRHYEFLIEAQELRARYAELLARAPILTEKGRQFLARLELERRAELFRETSGGVSNWARRRLVVGIAYLIAGLQYIQAKITPASNKQLAVRPAVAEAAPPASATGDSIRVMLLPASAYAGGNAGRGASRPRSSKRQETAEPGGEASARRGKRSAAPRGRVRGNAALADEEDAIAAEPRSRVARFSAGGSLMDRLSTVEHEEGAAPETVTPAPKEEKPEEKRKRFRLFRSG
jgi:hypothetical protein